MVCKFSRHAMGFIGSCYYRNVSEYDVEKSINKVKKFPKGSKVYIQDNEFKFVIVAALEKGKVRIITVITDLTRPISIGKDAKVLMVSWQRSEHLWNNLLRLFWGVWAW